MIINEKDYIEHYGTPRHSGRYPWGSGGFDAPPRNPSFLDTISELRSKGLSDRDIAVALKIGTTDSSGKFQPSITQLRAQRTIANAERTQSRVSQATRLKDKGLSNGAIAERMGLPGESSVRALLAPGASEKAKNLTEISDMLKRQVDSKKFIDVGSGVETHINTSTQIGVSKEKLNAAVAILKEQGYQVHPVNVPAVGTGHETRNKVLVPPGVTQKEAWENRFNIQQITEFSDDSGRTFGKIHDPLPIHPDRVAIAYKADGGDQADGVIYVRRGVDDVSLGNSSYSQVRIKVGPNHYLKGMAMYKDGLPKGKDLLFNTAKEFKDNDFKAMKELERDPDFPFKTVVRQIVADPGTPKERVTSVMNIVGAKEGAGEEGGWTGWSKNISSQVLSKQSPALAKEQLAKTYDRRKKEIDEINSLTNPTVKKKLLEKAAESVDSAAIHLKAATISTRDAWHVILPINSMNPNEIHAPRYNDGERVALIRYPHGGTFEIPELTVNNKTIEGKKLIGDAADAIGIHHSVAQRLSGADFDGDTVLVIPNNQRKIKTSRALEGLKDFDPQRSYPAYEGMRPMLNKQKEMGDISNLITDMTLQGAPQSEIVRAIRHSMVVIDAEKHNLNYKESARVEGIAKLKEEYQGGARSGASTLISRKKQEERVPERRLRRASEGGPIDSKGRQVFVPTGKTRRLADGSVEPKLDKVKKLSLTDDAHTLSSGTIMEKIYADHSNKLKALANEARLTASKTPPLTYSSSAKKVYAKEVTSLNSKLTLAKMNRPRERQAQVVSNAALKTIRLSNPHLEGDALTKIKFRELENARNRLGAKAPKLEITQDEWDAIQAGAIHTNTLNQILDKADLEGVRKLATPRKQILMTPTNTRRAKALLSSGNYTRAQVAKALGVSLSTLDRSTAE